MSHWDDIAREKLRNVIGASAADDVCSATMAELGWTELADADALYTFAQALIQRGGFVGAVGGLLSVHAAIHGASNKVSASR